MSSQIEYTAVPEPHEGYAQEVLRLIGDPNLAIKILEATPELVDQARNLIQALHDLNGVDLMVEDGRLWWGPTDQLTLQHIATLIAFRKPVMAVIESGFKQTPPPDLRHLEALLGDGPGGFPEQLLQGLVLRQGHGWGYMLENGKLEVGMSIDGLLQMLDRCAAEQGWGAE